MKRFIIRKREYIDSGTLGPYRTVYSGEKPLFSLSDPEYIKRKLLKIYGQGGYIVKSVDTDKKKSTVHFKGEVKKFEYRTWTKTERKKHIREKYFGMREKSIAFSVVVLTSVLLMYAIYFVLSARLSPVLAGVLIIILFFFVAFSTFFMDIIFWENE